MRLEAERNICVITIDLKASKRVRERGAIQLEVKELLKVLNHQFKSGLLAEFIITLGDEFQGALKTPKEAYNIFLAIQDRLRSPFYCGVGIGGIDTERSIRVVEMDGPAFHRSRTALEEAKKLNRDIVINSDSSIDLTLNIVLNLLSIIRGRWTRKQKEVVAYLKAHPGISYLEVAQKFGVTKQAVSKVLGSAHWKSVEAAEQFIRKLLETWVPEKD